MSDSSRDACLFKHNSLFSKEYDSNKPHHTVFSVLVDSVLANRQLLGLKVSCALYIIIRYCD